MSIILEPPKRHMPICQSADMSRVTLAHDKMTCVKMTVCKYGRTDKMAGPEEIPKYETHKRHLTRKILTHK